MRWFSIDQAAAQKPSLRCSNGCCSVERFCRRRTHDGHTVSQAVAIHQHLTHPSRGASNPESRQAGSGRGAQLRQARRPFACPRRSSVGGYYLLRDGIILIRILT